MLSRRKSIRLTLIATIWLLPLQLSPDSIDYVVAWSVVAFTTVPMPVQKQRATRSSLILRFPAVTYYISNGSTLFLSSSSDDHDGGGSRDDDYQQQHPLIVIATLLADRVDQQFGTYIHHAGRAWLNKDWNGVTASLAEAADTLTICLGTRVGGEDAPASTAKIWQVIAQELYDMSTIEGCFSVGPPASIPNWLAIQDVLQSVAAESSREDSTWMEDAAEEIDKLVECI